MFLVLANTGAHHILLSYPQISNVQVESAGKHSRKNNIFHGSSAESILGKVRLEALQRPFLVLWKMGKVTNTLHYAIKMCFISVLNWNF